jgi:hypothetical protein
LYSARLFVRQTWGLGGGREKVDSHANQLAGSVDWRRLVLTAGKLSVQDLFDDNATVTIRAPSSSTGRC